MPPSYVATPHLADSLTKHQESCIILSKRCISTHPQCQERSMLPAHISLAVSAHFRPGLALSGTGNGEKPRVLPATWAFSHLPQPEPISFSISRLYHKSSPSKGPKRPTFSPCRIFIQSRLLGLPFTGIQRRSGVATSQWVVGISVRRLARRNAAPPGRGCPEGVPPSEWRGQNHPLDRGAPE